MDQVRRFWCAALLSLWGLVPALASAQDPTQPAQAAPGDQVARSLFEAGRTSYDAGDYNDALQFFQQAYDRSQRPELLYNIGQSADRLRLDVTALAAFRKFLELRPSASNRNEVENRIRALEAIVARSQSTSVGQETSAGPSAPTPAQTAHASSTEPGTTAAPAAVTANADDEPNLLGQWWVWAGAGAVVATIVVVAVVASSGGGSEAASVPGGQGVVVMALGGQ